MRKEYIEGQKFNAKNYADKPLEKGEYESCTFSNCIFSNTDLSEFSFSDCLFEHCDLSMAQLKETTFAHVTFKNCKLLGLHFDDCKGFNLSFNFENCVLNFSSFYRLKLKNIHFDTCKLEEVDFVQADLTNAVFKDCDLPMAVFENTILEGADLRTALNFSIDPEVNYINKAKFSTQNIAGLLHKYNLSIE